VAEGNAGSFAEMSRVCIRERCLKGISIDDDDGLRMIYCEHIERVRRAIPPERLLIFNVREVLVPPRQAPVSMLFQTG
jgi:hypothetical protein